MLLSFLFKLCQHCKIRYNLVGLKTVVSSFLCKFILGIPGFLLPVFIQGLGYPVGNTVTTSFISKDTTNRIGTPSYLSNSSF